MGEYAPESFINQIADAIEPAFEARNIDYTRDDLEVVAACVWEALQPCDEAREAGL